MEKKEIEILNKTVIQANPLIEARKEMNVTEMRLFVLGLQGVKPHIKDDSVYDLEFHETIIPPNQLMDLLGQNYGSIANLKEQLEKAYDSKIILNYKNGGFEFKHIYEEMKYEPEIGLVIRFDNKMKPYILELAGQPYTKYKIKALFSLSSAYAWRILELLLAKQGYFQKGYQEVYVEYGINELREVLNVKKELYKLVNNFRRRVLDEPIKEINGKTDYFVWYDILREGRRIKGFRLWMKVKKEISSPSLDEHKKTPPELPAPEIVPTPAQKSDGEKMLNAIGYYSPRERREQRKEETAKKILADEQSLNPAANQKETAPTEETTKPIETDKKKWSDEEQADYDLMLKHGVWVQTAQKYIATYDHTQIERNIQGILKANPKGNIRDIGAVMANAIAHDTYKDEAEEKARAQTRAEERKKAEEIKVEKQLKETNEKKKKDKAKNEELAKLRENKSKEELVEILEKITEEYKNNNKILTPKMLNQLESNGISEKDFSSYQYEFSRNLIKYIK